MNVRPVNEKTLLLSETVPVRVISSSVDQVRFVKTTNASKENRMGFEDRFVEQSFACLEHPVRTEDVLEFSHQTEIELSRRIIIYIL